MRQSRLLFGASLLALFACSPGASTGVEPPPPPPASTGAIALSYSPTNASVVVTPTAGTMSGNLGSKTISLLPPTTYNVIVSQSGYISDTLSIPVVAGQTASVSASLSPLPAPSAMLTPAVDTVEAGSGNAVFQVRTQNVLSCVQVPSNTPVSGTIQVPVPNQATTIHIAISCPGTDGVSTATASAMLVVTAIPLITVQAFGVTGSGVVSAAGFTAVYTSGSWKDSLVLDATGAGAMPAPASVRAQMNDSSVCLKLIDRVNSTLKSTKTCTTKVLALAGGFPRLTVGSKVWCITRGSFAGNCVPISIIKAKTPAGDGLSFYWYSNMDIAPYWHDSTIVWAIDHSTSSFVAADSVNTILSIQDDVAKVGLFTFIPGQLGQGVIAGSTGVVASINPTAQLESEESAGWGGPPPGGTDQITHGALQFHSSGSLTISGGFYTKHGVVHLFDIGHSCGWVTVMWTLCSSEDASASITATDVAYIQYFYAIRQLQTNTGSPYGLEEMYQAELDDAPAGLRAQLVAPTKPSPAHFVNGMWVIN